MNVHKLRQAAAVLALVALAGSSAARARQVAPAAVGATVVITGHGWGHGVGLPQWGAYGYAQHGYKYSWIVQHFFQGTTLGRAPVASVRILLGDGRKSFSVSSPVAFKVKDGPGNSHALAAGTYVVAPDLKLALKPGAPPTALKGPITFVPGTQPLALEGTRYRGSVRLDVTSGKLSAINVVGLEQYLYGVVPSEMPRTWSIEALKAQAVVARSYALATRKTGNAYDLYPDTRSQVYLGVDHEYPSTNAAVDQTAGQVVLYGGKVATTYFFSSSGGRTANVQDVWPSSRPIPYLVSVVDAYDSISPYHNWGPYTFKVAALAKKLHVSGKVLDVQATVNSSGRTSALVLTTSIGKTTVAAGDVRTRLDLRSTWFSLGELSLTPPAAPVLYGSRLTLRGNARGFSPVMLQKRIGPTPWASVGPLKVGSGGDVATVVKPTEGTRYRLTAGTTTSAPVLVNVAPVVKLLPLVDRTTIRGLTKPVFPGGFVEIQRQSVTTWASIAGATVAADGTFQTTLDLQPGLYRARFAPGHGLVTGTSAVLRVLAA